MRIELRGLAKSFGRFAALRGLDLELPAGARVALIGPNGSGKTTLIRILLGMLRYRGSALLDGVEAAARARRAEGVAAYIPQAPPQFRVPVAELVAAVCGLRGSRPERVAELASVLGLDLAAAAGKEFRSLSGGMKQKLLIALALASAAPLQVMDEPTSSLDAAARDRFFELCADLPVATTLVLCSHRLEEIRGLVDRVVALDEGRIVFAGPVTEFLAARSRSVVEIECRDAGPDLWLRQAGFRRGADGRWRATVSLAGKRELVLAATRELGAGLLDLQVRDLERIELPGPEPGGEELR